MMWEVKRLGELAEIGRGSSPRPIVDQVYFRDGKIPWIKIADATESSKYIFKTKEYVNDYGASYSRILQPGSLILAASGILGFPMFLGVKGCIHDGWLYFNNYNGINPDFLYYQLITLRSFFNALSYGAAIQNINTGIVKNTKIQLPPINIQRKIAEILSSYDDLIENNNRRIEFLEQVAQQIYKEWFVRFRFPGYKTASFVKGIPVGWDIVKLGDVLEIKGGKRLPTNKFLLNTPTSYPYIKIKDITSNKYLVKSNNFEYVDNETRQIIKNYIVKTNDIIISIVGTIGAISVIDQSINNANLTENCVKLTNIKQLNKNYIYHLLASEYGKSEISSGIVGATQPKLPLYNIKRIKILKPEDRLLREFDLLINSFDLETIRLQNQNINLIKQRDLLLPRLMSGKLEV